MEIDLLITELDETTIQIDKMRYLTTQISTKAGEKTKHAKNALQYDFESQESVARIFQTSIITCWSVCFGQLIQLTVIIWRR